MGPGRDDAFRSFDDAVLADDAALEAARKAFAGRWDIIPAWGHFLAVPGGTPVVLAATLGGLTVKLRRLRAELEDER